MVTGVVTTGELAGSTAGFACAVGWAGGASVVVARVEGSTGNARSGAFVSVEVTGAWEAGGAEFSGAVASAEASTGSATGGALLSAGKARWVVSESDTAGSVLVEEAEAVSGSARAK